MNTDTQPVWATQIHAEPWPDRPIRSMLLRPAPRRYGWLTLGLVALNLTAWALAIYGLGHLVGVW